MWKPNWACTICGMLSSRRYSVQRHIRNLHAGFGLVVSYVGYMAGTLAGIYKPNSTLSQPSKRNVKHFDSLHMKNALKFSYSNPFVSPTEFDMYPPTSYSPHYDKLNKVMKSSSVSTQDLLTIMKTEFVSELGRGLARNFLYPSQANRQSFNTNTINKVSRSSLYPFATVEGNEIFGYRFQICKDCLLTEPLAVCYSKDGKSGRIEYKHACNTILVSSNREVIDKDSSSKIMYEKLPESMINFVNIWIKGKKGLIAIELPKNNNNDNATPEEIIKIKKPKSRQQLITFQYSRERHIDITLTNESQNHWAIRAIKDGQTTLNDYELTDFVRRVKDRTFAVVKVHMPLSVSSLEEEQQESIIHIYFMAIISADDTSSPLPNNDNDNNKTPLSANFAYKTLSDLYNDLANSSTLKVLPSI